MNFGHWTLGFGFRILNVRLGTLGFGRWPLGFGLWMLIWFWEFRSKFPQRDFGLWTLGFAFWALDFGLEVLHFEFWTSVLHVGRFDIFEF